MPEVSLEQFHVRDGTSCKDVGVLEILGWDNVVLASRGLEGLLIHAAFDVIEYAGKGIVHTVHDRFFLALLTLLLGCFAWSLGFHLFLRRIGSHMLFHHKATKALELDLLSFRIYLSVTDQMGTSFAKHRDYLSWQCRLIGSKLAAQKAHLDIGIPGRRDVRCQPNIILGVNDILGRLFRACKAKIFVIYGKNVFGRV